MASGKRQATSDLNHDNWNQEEEPEDRGTFRTAPPDELKNRVIKKARRKIASEAPCASQNAGVFSGFSGFGSSSSSKPTSTFSFLSNLTTNTANNTTATATVTTPKTAVAASDGDKTLTENVDTIGNGPVPMLITGKKKKLSTKKSPEYFGRIQELNRSVSLWIKAHVDKNPLCILTPIFDDYEKHLREIEKRETADHPELSENIEKAPTTKNNEPSLLIPKAVEKPVSTLFASNPEKTTKLFSATTTKTANIFDQNASIVTANKSEGTPKTNGFTFGAEKQPMKFGLTTEEKVFDKKPNPTFDFRANDDKPTTSAAAAAFSFGFPKDDKPTTVATPIFGSTSKVEKTTPVTKTEGKPVFTFSLKKSDDKPITSTDAFSFLNKNDDKPSTSAAASSSFIFGGAKKAVDNVPKTGFFFGSGDKPPSTGFSFKPGSTTFPFGSIANVMPPSAPVPNVSTEETDNKDEEDPPKVEFKQVVEEDAIYSKKCKVFVKKDGKYAERGVGTLFLKPIKDSDKTQLIVRADTNLGNILVNIIPTQAIPLQRLGTNIVMLICIPTSEFDKPTSVLLRVKTEKEADELFDTIEQYRI